MLRAALVGAVCPVVSLLLLVGCSSQSIKTHPVSGKVEIKDGDVAILTGSSVEFKHESDESFRPYGNIDSSGKFAVKTLYKGETLTGAPEGNYKARIILADQLDDGVPKRKGDPIHRRYYEFDSAKLSVKVPSSDYNISVSKK